MTSPPLIRDATVRFLRAHEPFARMAAADLETLAGRARLAYFAAGSVIADAGAAGPLHIVQRGHVRALDAAAPGEATLLGPGECFPLAPAAAEAGTAARFVAADDVFCLQLDPADCAALQAASAPFAEFRLRAAAALARESLGQVTRQFSQRAVDQQTLLQPLRALLRRAPVTCEAATALRAALARMHAESVGTIAIVDADGRPTGIFTLTDLLSRVVLAGVDLGLPVGAVMTPAPGSVDEETTAQEALAVMAAQRFHQLLVTRAGRIVGVVSERDLFALQRVSMQHVMESVRGARDVPALGRVARDIATLTDNLVAQGAAAEPLTRTIAALHDALTQRLFELLAPGHDLAGIDWCWLSLGSEGRREQTIASDQDNALLFRARDASPEQARARLLPFTRAANQALAALGFAPCPGNIMAGNPDYCLSVQEWRVRFERWLREPTPQALLAANICFDFRALGGTPALADDLRHWLDQVAPASPLFLRLLATNALAVGAPLGVVRTFLTEDGLHGATLDLKTHGTRLFVDAARALALAFGLAETGTAPRLRAAGRRLGMAQRDVDALVDAFQFLQLLRLRVQRDAAGTAGASANRLDPYALNELDQRMLTEALRQARGLQRLLARTLAP